MAEDETFVSIATDRAYQFAERYTPPVLLDGFYYAIFSLTPEVPRNLWITFHSKEQERFLLRVFLFALMFTFPFTAMLTALSGRLMWDADPATLEFLEDRWNIILYVLVCPAYIALCAGIIGLSAEFWAHRPGTSHVAASPEALIRPIRFLAATFFIFVAASFFTSQYQYDLLFNPKLTTHYWFIDINNGVKTLNRAGFYYIILNFVLLFVSLSGALCYTSLAVQAVRDAARLNIQDCGEIEAVAARFKHFQLAALLGRMLVICFMLNTVIWKRSPLAGATQTNVVATIVLILLVGVVGTRLPQMYIERRFAWLTRECAAAGMTGGPLALPTSGSRWMRIISNSLKGFITVGFIGLASPMLDMDGWVNELVDFVIGKAA